MSHEQHHQPAMAERPKSETEPNWRHPDADATADQVPHEPQWLSRSRVDAGGWSRMLTVAEKLLERVAALEVLLQENYQVTNWPCAKSTTDS